MYVKSPMHINSHTEFQLGFSKFLFFNGQYGQDGGTASLCQILSKSLQTWSRYLDFSIFQDGGTVKRVKQHHGAKFRRNRLNRGRDMAIFRFFKMAAAAILYF